MKVKIIFFVSVVSLALMSCQKKTEMKIYKPQLPPSVGENIFAERTFATPSSRLKFGFGDKVKVSSMDEENNILVDDFVADYSYDTEKKELWLCAKSIYADGVEYKNLKDYVNKKMGDFASDLDNMTSQSGLTMEAPSKKNFQYVVSKSYESQARTILESSIGYKYEISSDGIILDLTQIPPTTARGCELSGYDESETFGVNVNGNEMVFMNMKDSVDDFNTYYAFVEWDDDYTAFNGEVYSLRTIINDDTLDQRLMCSNEGAIKGTMVYATEKSDEFYFYNATVDFELMPICLSSLKKAYLSDTMYDYNESYTLIEGKELDNL